MALPYAAFYTAKSRLPHPKTRPTAGQGTASCGAVRNTLAHSKLQIVKRSTPAMYCVEALTAPVFAVPLPVKDAHQANNKQFSINRQT